VDDRDEFEPEADRRADPVTERVRIIGAQPAGQSVSGAPADEDVDAPAPDEAQLSFSDAGATGGADLDTPGPVPEPHARNGGDPLEPGSQVVRVETAPAVPDMPHWTDPPTGQVPAVIDRRGDDEPDQWTAPGDTGPAWREHGHEWDDSFDPSLLADDETRVGAMEEKPVEERRPWEFDDLGGTASGRAGGGDASWWDDDEEAGASRAGPAVSPRPVTPEPIVAAPSSAAPHPGRAEPGRDEPSRAEEPGGEGTPDATRTAVRPAASAARAAPDADKGRIPSVRDGGAPEVASISSSPLRLGPRDAGPPTGPPGAPRRAARGSAPATGGSGPGPTRNIPVAIATGVGAALVAVLCFQVGTVATLVLATLVVTLGAAECYAAMRQSGRRAATLPGLVATVMVMVAVYAKGVSAIPLVAALLVVTTLVWYLVGAERGSTVDGVAGTIFGFAWIGLLGAFAALMLSPSQYPHRHGIAFLFGAVVATIGADVGALAVGSWLGRHPLAPRVSPGKTWEGLVGGAVLAVVLSAAVVGQVHPWTVPKAALLGVVAAVVAPIGDLCESLVKRDLGLKDMGAMLPGHGGVLDRIDALLFVLPATYYLVRVLNLG
jgi:CDP-diglyceride synthetase